MAANYFATGEAPKRMGSAHPNIVPYQCFEGRDGKYIIIAVGNDRIWKDFCKALGFEKLADDEKYVTNRKRVENRNELIDKLNKIFLTKTRDEWLKALTENNVPCGPVYGMDEIFTDPQVLHREMLIEIEHPTIGRIKQIGIPIKFSEMPLKIKTPPPLLSQHTNEILQNWLGYSIDEINKLKKEDVI